MRHTRPVHYQLRTLWRFDAPQDAVWQAIVRMQEWPLWWAGVEQVDQLLPGDADGLGACHRICCTSVLPFRLRLKSLITRIEPPGLIEGRVDGDLQGVGCCRLHGEAHRTCVQYDWQVSTTDRWMNALGPLARPLFVWNHDAIMRQGGRGLARWLAAQGAGVTPLKPPPA